MVRQSDPAIDAWHQRNKAPFAIDAFLRYSNACFHPYASCQPYISARSFRFVGANRFFRQIHELCDAVPTYVRNRFGWNASFGHVRNHATYCARNISITRSGIPYVVFRNRQRVRLFSALLRSIYRLRRTIETVLTHPDNFRTGVHKISVNLQYLSLPLPIRGRIPHILPKGIPDIRGMPMWHRPSCFY